MSDVHIPFLSEDEKLFLNTAATYSQVRRMSSTSTNSNASSSTTSERGSMEDMIGHRRPSSSLSFLFKRRGSSASSASSAIDPVTDEDYFTQSAKARELELLIFDQPQRTVRLSLTPRCAV
jgi:hypothetical protein